MYPKFVILVFAAALCFFGAGRAPAQDAAGVRATLKFAEDKTTYRIGESIRLVLELTADREGYTADTLPDGMEPTWDTITISPESGINYWLDEYLEGRYGLRDVFSRAKITSTAITVPILLNDSIRFERAGRYSVKLSTRRVSPEYAPGESKPSLTLTTNEISFEVQPLSNADEEIEVKRIAQLIETARGWQAQEAAGRQLAFLIGEVSTREKVRRFLSADPLSSNYVHQIYRGLFIARNRALVIQLLEAAMRDPNTPVTSSLLGVVSKLRLLQERAGIRPKPRPAMSPAMRGDDPRFGEIRDAYVTELAAGLDKRSGKSQTTTAMTLFMNLPKDPDSERAFRNEIKRILTNQFDSLHPFDQEYLVRMKWDQLRDPSFIPSLKRMLTSTGVPSKNIHDSALKRLIEIAPEEARPYVIAEIRDPKSLVDLEVLGSLKDESLSEADESLLEQIRRLAASSASFSAVYLKHKTSLAARYATRGIYADLIDIYRTADDKLPLDARAGFLAYFARHNEAEGVALLEQALDKVGPTLQFNILLDFTKLYFSDAVHALLRKRLESDDPDIVSTAAYLISKHGPATDQTAIERRLQRWRAQWSDRVAEADANGQGRAERELILALLHAKSWKPSPARAKELQQSCITTICKQNFRLQ